MVAVYLLFGLAVERYGPRRGGRLRAFTRLLCSPITRPVTRFLAPGASERRVLAVSFAIVAVSWAILVALDTALRRG
jgi:hypothetical protein